MYKVFTIITVLIGFQFHVLADTTVCISAGWNSINQIQIDLSKKENQFTVEYNEKFAKNYSVSKIVALTVVSIQPEFARSFAEVDSLMIENATDRIVFMRNRPLRFGGGSYFVGANRNGNWKHIAKPGTALELALYNHSIFVCRELK